MSSTSESDSESSCVQEAEEDPELELNLAIEGFLTQLENVPQADWPKNTKDLLEMVEPHCKFPMPPELLARFLVQEGLLVRKVSEGRASFSFSPSKIAKYDFETVEDGVNKLNDSLAPSSLIPLTGTTLQLFKRVAAWARINLADLSKYDDSSKESLSRLLREVGRVPVFVEPQLVVDELSDRKLLHVKEETVEYDLHHLTGKLPGNTSQGGSWVKSILYILVIVLFWSSMIGQIIPQSVGGVGGMKGKTKAKGK